jgi:hypothetical protein
MKSETRGKLIEGLCKLVLGIIIAIVVFAILAVIIQAAIWIFV